MQTHRTTHFWVLLGVVAKSEGEAGGGAAESGSAVCGKCVVDDGLTEYERQLHVKGLMIRVGLCGGKG